MQKRDLACFVLVVLAALAWRFAGLTFDSLWLDEGYQSIVDAHGHGPVDFAAVPMQPFIFKPPPVAAPSEMLSVFRQVDPLTPPLYQLLLNRWIAAFGDTDFAVRSLSALISSAGVGVLYVVGRLLVPRAALWGALLMAFSPFDIYYGQEVRMYGLEQLCATVSVGALLVYLLRLRGGVAPVWRVVALLAHAVGAWAMINSHYTGLFVFAFEIVIALCFVVARRSWRMLFELAAAWALVGILWIPWWPLFRQAAALRTASFYVARKPSLWWPFMALFFRIPANWLVFLSGKQVVGPALPIYATSFLIMALSLASLFAPHLVAGHFNRRNTINRLAIFLWALIPAIGLWLVDVVENHRVIEISRYMIATAPAVYLMAGEPFAYIGVRSRLLIALLAVHLLLATVNNVAWSTVMHQREPWRQMAALVETQVRPDQLLLVSQYYDIWCLDRYLKVPMRQVGVSSNTTTAQLNAILGGATDFALVTGQEGDLIQNVIPPRFRLIDHQDLGHSLHFRRYSLR